LSDLEEGLFGAASWSECAGMCSFVSRVQPSHFAGDFEPSASLFFSKV
jgi:hypothetical protein